jgi:ribosomal protein S19E (S16A)
MPPDEISEALAAAIAAFNQLTPEQQSEVMKTAQDSAVFREIMRQHPDWTVEQAKELFDQVKI